MYVQPVVVQWSLDNFQAVMRVPGGGDVNLGYHDTPERAIAILTNARALLYLTNTAATILPITQEFGE
jgi:hypothetical protein